MATRTAKRRTAAKKAARTRKANTAKRRAAGKKAAKTRKRRYGKTGAKRGRNTAKKRAGARGGASAFGGGIATGAGLAIGGGLVALIGALLLLPLQKKEEEAEPTATAGALDAQSLGLTGDDVIVYANALDTSKSYQGAKLCN